MKIYNISHPVVAPRLRLWYNPGKNYFTRRNRNMKRLLALLLCALTLLGGMALAEAGAVDGEYSVTYEVYNVSIFYEDLSELGKATVDMVGVAPATKEGKV